MSSEIDIKAHAEHQRNTRSVFRDALSLFVGQGKRFSVEAIAAASGIGTATIHAYLNGRSCPEWVNAVALLNVLPVEFAAAVLRPAGLAGLTRIDGEVSAAETLGQVAEGVASLATALADGRIDHQELPRVRQELTEAMVAITQFLQKLNGVR
ncbi:MAG: hypothetical protein HQL45_15705 [Alphaproteobacteria bacterium]|nr:hypothetical protein [Alphaproteobacteria bacterium]